MKSILITAIIAVLAPLIYSLFDTLKKSAKRLAHKAFKRGFLGAQNKKPIFVFISIGGLLVALYVCAVNPLIFPVAVGASIASFAAVKRTLARARTKRFMKQFLPALGQMLNLVKSGSSFEETFKTVANENPPPLCEEFCRILAQYEISRDFCASLEKLSARIPQREVELFVNSVIIAKRTGSNIVEQLANIRRTVSDRLYMEGKIRAMTAQAKAQGIISSFAPLLIATAVNWFDPQYFRPLLSTPLGHLIIFSAVLSNIVGLLLMLKLSNLKF